MRIRVFVGLVALLVPALASNPAAGQAAAAAQTPHVRVTSRIVIIDREALTRAGLSYVVLGGGRVRVDTGGRRGAARDGAWVGTHSARAFLDAVRSRGWLRSESTQQVLTTSGREAVVSSNTLTLDRRAARTRGPSLVVIPTVLADRQVKLQLSARVEDDVTYRWGYGVDGSPAAVDTEIIATDGEEIIVGSSSVVETARESGLLWWGTSERGRDVLVAVTAQVVAR
jgi:hypothetical protein